jgi:hypothetical protein
MMAYPLPTWNGHSSSPAAHDEGSPVSQVLTRLHTHLQRNLVQLLAHEEPAAEPVATVSAAGESSEVLADVSECVAIKHRGRQVLTAVRTANNQLTLDSWRVNADGSVIQTGSSGLQAQPVAQLDLTQASKFVLAYRSPNQQLKLVSWNVSNTGAIYRAGESAAWREPVRQVKVRALGDDQLLTACILRNRRLKLMSWQLGVNADFTCLQEFETTVEGVREVAITVQPRPTAEPCVITVSRTASLIVVQTWQISANGTIRLLGQAELPAQVTQVRAILDGAGRLVTAMRSASGQLRLVVWEQQTESASFTPGFDSGAMGECIRRFGIMRSKSGFVTALVTAERRLEISGWVVDSTGRLQRRAAGGGAAVYAGPVALCSEALEGNAPILAGFCTAQGSFRLTAWQ